MADQLAQARAALRLGDAATARAVLVEAGDEPAVLEARAAAAYVLFDYDDAIANLEAAYAGHREAADGSGAARVARTLGYLYGSAAGDWAVASGWIARAKSLLVDAPDSSERGWVALTEGMFSDVRRDRESAFRAAVEVGRRTGDTDLTFSALSYLGASLVHDDRTVEGMLLLDEALAAVAGGDVEDFVVVEEIFCQLFSACERAQDVQRAEQWLRVGAQIADRRNLPSVGAYCRTHYGGILTAAGRWIEAEQMLTEAVRLWALGKRTLKAGALVRLADLRIKQGRYDEAERLLDGLHDGEAVGPLAELHLARGEAALALDVLEHALQKADPGSSSCIPLLALLVEAQRAAGESTDEAIGALAACADAHPSPYADAVVAFAKGGRENLRDAYAGFAQAQLPLMAGRCRLEVARVSEPDVAVKEARAALVIFEGLPTTRYVDEATALLRRLGQKVSPPRPGGLVLSKREQDVLVLLGEGLSNPEIAERLFISRKTVEHHVGNILAKLGLRNRGEATAYAVRGEPAGK